MALQLILKTLLSCPDFVESKEKNWDAVCKLVPGSTPQQCERQWEEIEKTAFIPSGGRIQQGSSKDSMMSTFVKSLLQSEPEGVDDGGFSEDGSEATSVSPEIDAKQSENENEVEKVTSSRSLQQSNGQDQKENNNQRTQSSHSRKQPKTQGSSKDLQVQGPNMVIHVCDESKNLKQDFTCPRDLLIREMRYFAEYLSVDAQRWEEVDISVHCDVQIFDWLIRYVKRNLPPDKKVEDKPKPQLEPNNVISILISSDFLKMDSLVNECIAYCHENMSAIVSTPCNMNCINDKLVTRIASLFTQNELDSIKDRKDKFKSKLFCKKIEELFKVDSASGNSSGLASTLYRCGACRRLLTSFTQSKLHCVLSRMTVDHRGQVLYAHVRDPSFDVNDYLISIREQLKSWREVYWRLWGSISVLYCFRCKEYFPGTELGHCRYHMKQPEYSDEGGNTSVVGVYPCCEQTSLRFDPTGTATGCSVRDHRVTKSGMNFTVEKAETPTESPGEQLEGSTSEQRTETRPKSASSVTSISRCKSSLGNRGEIVNDPSLIEDIFSHRDMICVSYQRLSSTRSTEVNVFNMEALTYGVATNMDTKIVDKPTELLIEKKQSESSTHLPPIRQKRHRAPQRSSSLRKMKLPIKADDCDIDEDEEEEEEDSVAQKIVVQVKHKSKHGSAGKHGPVKSTRWDSQRSLRWNQDAQREEDLKRMNDLVLSLMKQRPQSSNHERQSHQDKQKPKEFVGGIYSKLEHQFRQAIMAKYQPTTSLTSGGPRVRKNQSKQS